MPVKDSQKGGGTSVGETHTKTLKSQHTHIHRGGVAGKRGPSRKRGEGKSGRGWNWKKSQTVGFGIEKGSTLKWAGMKST